MAMSATTHMQHQSCAMVDGKQHPNISNVTRADAETGCATLERTHLPLRGNVSFCSIGCVLATKFGGEARIH